MRSLPEQRIEDYRREAVRVSRNSTVLVRGNFYSVPTQLIGERVEARVHAERLEVWYGGREIEQMPRLRGSGRHRISYRHLIDSLVRKPGAFAGYRYREDLFPRTIFRSAYDSLREACATSADRSYIRLLQIAATESEEAVAEVLRDVIAGGEAVSVERVSALAADRTRVVSTPVEAVRVAPVVLAAYDALLTMTPAPEVAR